MQQRRFQISINDPQVAITVAVFLVIFSFLAFYFFKYSRRASVTMGDANIMEMQKAYEHAKLTVPEILTNEDVGLLATNMRTAGVMLSVPANLSFIKVRTNTSIVEKSALFYWEAPSLDAKFRELSSLRLVQPFPGQAVALGVVQNLKAEATAQITRVAFFVDGERVEEIKEPPYVVQWIPSSLGIRTLTVTATLNDGSDLVAAPVRIEVVNNFAPVVSLQSPTDGQVFLEGQPIQVIANASDPDGKVDQVDLLVGTNFIACLTAGPYSKTWKPTKGEYVLRAAVYDNLGAAGISSPAKIYVLEGQSMQVKLSPSGMHRAGSLLKLTVEPLAIGTVLTQVLFIADGNLLGVRSGEPFALDYQIPEGTHIISAVALATNGSKATCSVELLGNGAPKISFISPPRGGVVRLDSMPTLLLSAHDPDDGVLYIELFCDNEKLNKTNQLGPEFPWIPIPKPGPHVLSARAYDALGYTEDAINVTVQPGEPDWIALTDDVTTKGGLIQRTGLRASAAKSRTVIEHYGVLELQIQGPAKPLTLALSAARPEGRGDQEYGIQVFEDQVVFVAKTLRTNQMQLMPGDGLRLSIEDDLVHYYVLRNDQPLIHWNPSNSVFSTAFAGHIRWFTPGAASQVKVSLIGVGHPGNNPPTVAISIPSNGQTFTNNIETRIAGSAVDMDGDNIARVELFINGQKLTSWRAASFAYLWKETKAGTYEIVARASDSHGDARSSAPVKVEILRSEP